MKGGQCRPLPPSLISFIYRTDTTNSFFGEFVSPAGGRRKKIRVIHFVPNLGGFGVSFARNSFHPAARNETLFEAASLQAGLQLCSRTCSPLLPRQLMLQRRRRTTRRTHATHHVPPTTTTTCHPSCLQPPHAACNHRIESAGASPHCCTPILRIAAPPCSALLHPMLSIAAPPCSALLHPHAWHCCTPMLSIAAPPCSGDLQGAATPPPLALAGGAAPPAPAALVAAAVLLFAITLRPPLRWHAAAPA
jgi:hypothetical protein